MSQQVHAGRYFEDFEPGTVIRHLLTKTIVESDNNLFCLLTMNPHPVHLDMEYARQSRHGKILVVGTLVLSLAVGISVTDISFRAIANLSYDKVQHLAPVFINDTIRAESTVVEKRLSNKRPDCGLVTVRSAVYNQREEMVLTFVRTVLVPRRANETSAA